MKAVRKPGDDSSSRHYIHSASANAEAEERTNEAVIHNYLSPRAFTGGWGVGLATVGLVIGVAATLFA
jgi:hypothetical protein